MKPEQAHTGARVVDSLPFSQTGSGMAAVGLWNAGAQAVAGYLGVINQTRLGYILGAGMAYVPVSLASEYTDGGADEVAQLKALAIPQGVTVYADLEGLGAFKSNPSLVISKLNEWATDITAAGYIPGLYVGSPQPLTSSELWLLKVSRYWKGQGACRDRYGNLAEPTTCGWGMTQMYPSVQAGGTLVDWNMVGQDYLGRLPTWCVA